MVKIGLQTLSCTRQELGVMGGSLGWGGKGMFLMKLHTLGTRL